MKAGDVFAYEWRTGCPKCDLGKRTCKRCPGPTVTATGEAVVWSAAPGGRVWATDERFGYLLLVKLATPKRPGHWRDYLTEQEWKGKT